MSSPSNSIDKWIASAWIPWLCAVISLVLPVWIVMKGLPIIGELGAQVIPSSWEKKIGEFVLNELTIKQHPTTNKIAQSLIRDRVANLIKHTSLSEVRVEFIGGRANAFALPGDILVITDGMLTMIENADQLDAVIGHELGHLSHRDVVKAFSETAFLCCWSI
jgi:predicted Zn-dependent protease